MEKKTRLLLSIIFSCVILLAAYLSFIYMQQEKMKENVVEKEEILFTSVYKDEFDKNPKEIVINGKTIKIAITDGLLYVNDKKIDYYNIDYIYYTGNLLFLVKRTNTGERYKVFDNNGDNVIINYNEVDEDTSYVNLRIEDNQIIADVVCEEDECSKVLFTYQDKELKLQYLKKVEKKEEPVVTKKSFSSLITIVQDFNVINEKKLTINAKTISIKNENGILFVNGKNMGYQVIDDLYVVGDLIFIGSMGQLGETYRVFNEDGDEITINQNNIATTVQFFNLRIDKNGLYADSKDVDCNDANASCDHVRKVEFVYENKKITLRGIYTTNKEKFTIFEKNNFDGAGNAYIVNGKQVELKIGNGILYVNNQKFDYFTPKFVYVMDKLIMIMYETNEKIVYHFFDEKGKEVTIDYNGISKDFKINSFEVINGCLIAKNNDSISIEFVYENGIITMYRNY